MAADDADADEPRVASHSPLVGSPKHHRNTEEEEPGRNSGEAAIGGTPCFQEEEMLAPPRERRRAGTSSGFGPVWCDEFAEEVSRLLHAPRDLFIVYFIKVVECTAYFGISYVYTHYLTEEFGMTDQEAGNLYAIYGLSCTVVGVLMGVSIDRLGVRKAMFFGCVVNTAARIMYTTASTSFTMWMAAVVVAPVGAAFGVPALALGVRRYTHKDNRSFAFSFFYMALCLACIFSSILINRIRSNYIDGVMMFGVHWTWMRLVVFWCTVLTSTSIVASYCVRDIQVDSDKPLEEEAYEVYRNQGRTNLREILNQRRFWRVVGVTFIFCGVRMAFRHMDATFPKYFIRTHGRDAPFEIIVGFEPFLTMLLSPIVTLFLGKMNMRLDKVFLLGAFISGMSVFILSIEETYNSAIGFVAVIALGEAIWSPKLYEFSTMAAPEGREGIYVAISFAPMYLSSVPVGWLSGYVLAAFCPRNSKPEERQGQLMWFIIGLTSFSSFVLMCLCRHRLFPPEEFGEDEEVDSQDDDDF